MACAESGVTSERAYLVCSLDIMAVESGNWELVGRDEGKR
jgi:hypothetical protein